MKWTQEITDTLIEKVKDVQGEIPYNVVETIAGEFDVSARSVAGKLRSLGYAVAKKTITATKNYNEKEEALIKQMVSQGAFIEDIAARLGREVKQIRGKLLSMKLTAPTKNKKEPKKKSYSPEEEAKIAQLVESGAFIEDIADALGKTVPQIRGKLLSMKLKAPMKNKKEKGSNKVYTDEVVEKITAMFKEGKTTEQIAEELELSPVSLHRKFVQLGLIESKAKKAPFWNEETEGKLVELFENTTDTLDIIAEKLGTSYPLIAKKLKALGYNYEARKPIKKKEE
jgi:hypothetical protein